MSEMFDDSSFQWGQAGLPGTGITEGEKTTFNSRLNGLEDDLADNYYTQAEVDALVAAALPIFIHIWHGGATSTTSLTTPTWLIDNAVTLPPGLWRLQIIYSGILWRSVNSGEHIMACDQDGSVVPIQSPSGAPLPKNQAFRQSYTRNNTVNVTDERAVPLRLGVYGTGTAGTTTIAYGSITGQAIRIGEPT